MFTDSDIGSKRKAQLSDSEKWGGEEVRTMLQPLYLIAFLCLLRFDEALRIQWNWIELEKVENPSGKMLHQLKLMLPFRKTHQTGGEFHSYFVRMYQPDVISGIAPFYLLPNYEKPWLCPITAIAKWIRCITERKMGTLDGFVFRKKFSARKTSSDPQQCLVSKHTQLSRSSQY